jgi:hypothetical protein
MFKKLIQTIVIGCAIALCLLFGINQSQSFAASLPVSLNLQSGVGEKIAVSNIRELKESSGQMVYQARQTLKDQHVVIE